MDRREVARKLKIHIMKDEGWTKFDIDKWGIPRSPVIFVWMLRLEIAVFAHQPW
jgi:hypothetical protein